MKNVYYIHPFSQLMVVRRLIFLLVLVLLVGFGTRAFAQAFADVEGTQFEDAFTYLSQKAIVQGYDNGLGKPNDPLNRAEALKVILTAVPQYGDRLAWYRNNMPPMPLFYDVDQKAWYAPYVELSFEQSIITGYPDGTFRPGNLLTVEEAVALLMRGYREQGTRGEARLSEYIENRDNQWFTPSINRAVERNLVMPQDMLRLGEPITRGQFFDMVYRLHSIEASGQVAFAETVQRPTTTATNSRPYIPGSSAQAVRTPGSSLYASEKYFAITMPSLGVSDLTITHPEDPFSTDGVLDPLKLGVGHLFSYPGAGGKIMVYGHSSGYPWDVSQYTKIFRKINQLHIGDKIYVTYAGTLYEYEVTEKETVDAADTTPFKDDGSGEELILYTCWPPDSIQQRYLVHALPVDSIVLR